MATLKNLKALNIPLPISRSRRLSGSNNGADQWHHTHAPVCSGLVQVKDEGINASWRWLWLDFREHPAKHGILGVFEPGRKGGPDILVESIRVQHVERVGHHDRCLLLHAASRRRCLYIRFSNEPELYDWLEEIYSRSPSAGVVDGDSFTHNMHIRLDEERGSLAGFPQAIHAQFHARFSNNHPPLPPLDPSESGVSSIDSELPSPESTFTSSIHFMKREDAASLESNSPHPQDPIGFTSRFTQNSKIPIIPEADLHEEGPVSPPLVGTAIKVDCQNVRDLTGKITDVEPYPIASGGFSDIYRARMTSSSNVRVVGIKVFRTLLHKPRTDSGSKVPNALQHSRLLQMRKTLRRLNTEIRVWQHLHHPNIVELLGICHYFGEHPSLVSLWFENGHIMEYLEGIGNSATYLLRLQLVLGIANGLQYLHAFSPPILHGDLKGSNVLVDQNGVPMLTDFGLSSVFEEFVGHASLTGSGALAGSVRWMAVELVCLVEENNAVRFTPASDVYSFGSTMLEIFTGEVPYAHRRLDVHVIMDILNGVRHSRDERKVTEELWNLMEMCWMDLLKQRPSMEVLTVRLAQLCQDERKRQWLQSSATGIHAATRSSSYFF